MTVPLLHSTKAIAPTPSPSPDADVDEADMEEEDDEVVEEEEEEEDEEVDEDEAEEEEEEEAITVKDPEYEYPIDSGPYQTSDYLDSFYDEKSHKPTTSAPLMKGDSCECPSFSLLMLPLCVKILGLLCLVAVVNNAVKWRNESYGV